MIKALKTRIDKMSKESDAFDNLLAKGSKDNADTIKKIKASFVTKKPAAASRGNLRAMMMKNKAKPAAGFGEMPEVAVAVKAPAPKEKKVDDVQEKKKEIQEMMLAELLKLRSQLAEAISNACEAEKTAEGTSKKEYDHILADNKKLNYRITQLTRALNEINGNDDEWETDSEDGRNGPIKMESDEEMFRKYPDFEDLKMVLVINNGLKDMKKGKIGA